MTFDELLAQVLELLQREGRVSYRALKRRCNFTGGAAAVCRIPFYIGIGSHRTIAPLKK